MGTKDNSLFRTNAFISLIIVVVHHLDSLLILKAPPHPESGLRPAWVFAGNNLSYLKQHQVA